MKLFNWIREIYSIPTNPMWPAWLCIILASVLLFTSLDARAEKGDLWLGMNVVALGYDQWRAVVGFIPVRAFGFGNTDVITVQVSAKF